MRASRAAISCVSDGATVRMVPEDTSVVSVTCKPVQVTSCEVAAPGVPQLSF